MTSIEKVRDKTFDTLLASSKEGQLKFMNSININELKEANARPLLKKFIAMKVFTVAIYAVVIPLSLTLYAVEELLVSPIKRVINALIPGEHEAFIEAVCQADHGRAAL